MAVVIARIASTLLTQSGAKLDLLHCETMPPARHICRVGAIEASDPRLQRANSAATDRYQVVVGAGHLDQFIVAGALIANDAVDIDDVAAMHTDKAAAVQPRFDVADGER